MSAARGTAASRGGGTDDRHTFYPPGGADGSTGDECSAMVGRFFVVDSSAALCFHIHRLPPLTGRLGTYRPALPRCKYIAVHSPPSTAAVFAFPRARHDTRDRDNQRRTHADGPHPVFCYRCVTLRSVAPMRVLYGLICYHRNRRAPSPPPFFVLVFLRALVSARASE